jgi:hypothetical protein
MPRPACSQARIDHAPRPTPLGLLAHTVRAPIPRDRVFRIVYGSPDRNAPLDLLRYLYGAEILFDRSGDHGPPQRPCLAHGVVVHNDRASDPLSFVGDKNPAISAPLPEFHDDKWEEHLFLTRIAPELSPKTTRLDQLLHEAGARWDARDPRCALELAQRIAGRRFDRWVMKLRDGFGSDGNLPTHEMELPAVYDAFLGEQASGETDHAEGRVLEAMLVDPSRVIVQEMIESVDELRVHAVEGRLLEGATIPRWIEDGVYTTEERIDRGEEVVRGLLRRARTEAPRLSCGLDLLVTKDGHRIVDLNSGLESGMYFPENDLYVTNLLAERYSGSETPYLRDMRAFDRAPLFAKLFHAERIDRRVGEFVRDSEADGFYDRLVSGWIAEVRRAPTLETTREAWRQINALGSAGEHQLARFLDHPAVAPFADRLARGIG